MPFFQVKLDMILDTPCNKAGVPFVRIQGEAGAELKRFGLSAKVIEQEGPAGGNPLVEIRSNSRQKLVQYISEVYLGGDVSDLDIFEIKKYKHVAGGQLVQVKERKSH